MKILQLIISRLSYGLLVIVLVATGVSALIFLGQVDPARLTFGQRADVKTVEAKREAMGLDDPLRIQLARYLGDVSPIQWIKKPRLQTLDYSYSTFFQSAERKLILKFPYLRESYQSGRRVSQLIKEAFPVTLLLAVSSFGIALIIGLFLGILSAIKYDSIWDRLIIGLSSIGYSLPSYVVAMVVAIIFAYYLQWLTGLNIQGSIFELDELGNDVVVWKNLILPSIALGIRPLAVITQITRSSMLDALSQGFVQTAKAKGLAFTQIIKKHVFRNALNPIATAVTGWFASLLAGAFFVETVFNFKGLGSLTVNALLTYDLPVILACIIFTSSLFVLINLMTDILYLIIDPRQKTA
ncbi:ABC transporter permease [Saprospiraceae bacterium]|nr:ABC transporter permease [Saprospiraceae bacterium]